MQVEVTKLNSADLVTAITSGEVSSEHAVEESLSQIARLDPNLHAFLTVDGEAALAEGRRADCDRTDRRSRGALHGGPIAVKDLAATKGMRTTYGSRRFEHFVPTADDACVERLRKSGAILLGKTKAPEFGFGAVCENAFCGATANPWNEKLTSGGSSGESAVAVTAGMAFLAHGTDFGGSVCTPASFCGCVGLRPTPGLVAEPSRPLDWNTLATQGILSRTVADAGLMLRAMVSPDVRDPASGAPRCWLSPESPATPEDNSHRVRMAVSATLGDAYLLDSEVEELFDQAVETAKKVLGPRVSWFPDASKASWAFKTLRAAVAWHSFRGLLADGEDDLMESLVWNVRQGEGLSADGYLDAEAARTRVYRAFMDFFADCDVLLLPAMSVLPFPNAQKEVHSVGGWVCDTIIDYLSPTFIISLVGFPVLSLPAGWSRDGRSFGIQIVGRPYEEETVLYVAARLEQAGFRHSWPSHS